MATQGEWKVVSRRKRFPDSWKEPTDVRQDKVRAYSPYQITSSYAQVVGAGTGPRSGGSVSSHASPRSSPSNSRPPNPTTPPSAQFFTSPHSPTTLRFPPLPAYPEWRGRCFRCCKVGHSVAQCSNPTRCGQCWKGGHIASKCKEKKPLNPGAKPFKPLGTSQSPTMTDTQSRGEPDFAELLKGPAPTQPPELPDDRPEKVICFVGRDEAFFQEVEKLQNSVVMYGANQGLLMEAHQVMKMAVDTGLMREEEVRIAELTNERFLIHLPRGLPVENFMRRIPACYWEQGFHFQ